MNYADSLKRCFRGKKCRRGNLFYLILFSLSLNFSSALLNFRVSFELEPGTVGNTTDFKEANKRLEWGLKKARIFPSISLSFLVDLA